MSEHIEVALILVFIGFLGVKLLRDGFRRVKQRRAVNDTPTVPIRSAAAGDIEVQGTAHPLDGRTLPAPVTGRDALAVKYTVREYSGDEWYTVDEGIEGGPFVVDDGTGELLVDPPKDATVDFEEGHRETIEVHPSDTVPGTIRAFRNRNDAVSEPASSVLGRFSNKGKRKYIEDIIEPDEGVYVFGCAERADAVPGSHDADHIVRSDDGISGLFLLSDKSAEELVESRRWTMAWRIPVGALFILLGLVGLIALGIGGAVAVLLFAGFIWALEQSAERNLDVHDLLQLLRGR